MGSQHERLIQCSACGHSVDFQAQTCPTCGNNDVVGKHCCLCEKRTPGKNILATWANSICRECADKHFSRGVELECETCGHVDKVSVYLPHRVGRESPYPVLLKGNDQSFAGSACSSCGRPRSKPEPCGHCGFPVLWFQAFEFRKFKERQSTGYKKVRRPVHHFCIGQAQKSLGSWDSYAKHILIGGAILILLAMLANC